MRRAIDRTLTAGPEDTHFQSLRYLVAESFKIHNIFTAVIACRVSPPPPGTTEQDGIKTSLLRQQRFLEAMVPSGVPIIYVKAKEVSAYKSDFTTLMQKKLRSTSTKAFVLTTSLDRATRSTKTSDEWLQIHQQRGHMFMSFLWSDKAELPVADVLHIPLALQTPQLIAADNRLEEQRCGAMSTRNLPVIKPVIWIPCSPEIKPMVQSTQQAAENYSRSGATRFQGESSSHIPIELKKGPGKPFDKIHIEQWNDFLNGKIPISVEVKRAEQHSCGCLETGHDSNCTCSCSECTRDTTCPCANLDECVCPRICTCRCKACHLHEKTTIDCAVPDCPIPAIGPYGEERLCARHDREYSLLSRRDDRRRYLEENALEIVSLLQSGAQVLEVTDEASCHRPGCRNAILSDRREGNFCSAICKRKAVDITRTLQASHMRVCSRLGCQNLVRHNLNYSPFCSSACLHDTKKGLQSLPAVSINNEIYLPLQMTQCALTACKNDAVDSSPCCSKVCRIL